MDFIVRDIAKKSPRFKVGDKVRILRYSKYVYQSNSIGAITSIEDIHKELWYNVIFLNPEYENTYEESHLELAKKKEPLKYEDLIL